MSSLIEMAGSFLQIMGYPSSLESQSLVDPRVGLKGLHEYIGLKDPFDKHQTQKQSHAQWAAFALALLALAGLTSAVFSNHGPKKCSMVVLYVCSLSTMSISLRNVFQNDDFEFPRFVTSLHFFVTTFLAFGIIQFNKARGEVVSVPDKNTFCFGILPAAIAFALSLGFCNMGIEATSAHFFEMVDSTGPIMTAVMVVLLGLPFRIEQIVPLLFLMGGISLCWTAEASINMFGLGALLLGGFIRAFKVALEQVLMTPGTNFARMLSPIELVFYNCGVSFFVMSAWSLWMEGTEPFVKLNRRVAIAIGLTVVNAAVINIIGMCVIKELGAVAAQMTGILKGFVALLGATATMGEVIVPQQIVGYAAVVASIAWYNIVIKQLRDEDAEAKVAEAEESTPLVSSPEQKADGV